MNKMVEEINQYLATSLDHLQEGKVKEAMYYSLLAPGKRIRPILMLKVLQAYNLDYHDYIDVACAIEFVHTYSLIHDDLPAMDNDDLRRGKPTTHVKYGEANAILVGDGLLTHSFEIFSNANVNDKTLRKLLYEISYAAGVSGMVMGQFIDLYYEERDIDFEMLKILHSKKTGAMIRGAVRVGAIASEKENINLENITKYGEAIGLAFQIQDDILDVISDNETLGKTVGKDEKEGKLTYVKQFGLEGAKEKAIETSKEAIDYLNVYDDNEAKNILIELANYIVERKS